MSRKGAQGMFDLDVIIKDLPTGEPADRSVSRVYGRGLKKSKASNVLDNYTEVPKAKIGEIPVGTYVRYADLDGTLKPGGGKLKSLGVNAEGVQVMNLGNYNMGTKKYYAWSVKLPEISVVYKNNKSAETHSTPVQSTMQSSNTGQSSIAIEKTHEPEKILTEEDQIMNQIGSKMLFNDTDMLKQKIDMLEAEVQRIDGDMKKIYILVKRLYKAVFQGQQQI